MINLYEENRSRNTKEKSICVFTQTYSDHRKKLFEFHNLDILDTEFRNVFKKNIYSFHNCGHEYVRSVIGKEYFGRLKNVDLLSYNSISYTESWKKSLNYMVENGFDYLIFLQDDCFTLKNNNSIIGKYLNFINKNEFDMINLECPYQELNCDKPIIYSDSDFEIYDTSSEDFVNRGYFSFDDGPFIAKIEFLIKEIYDDVYFNHANIWDGENYLNGKIKKNKIQRLTSNLPLYCRFNIIGPNSWNSVEETKRIWSRFSCD